MANNIDLVNQYQNALLGSFESYYNEMAKNNQYDITVDATVVDVEKKPEGIYRVKTSGAEFEAYATAGNYYKNDIVLVQIPNGNYKNPKYILGRKADLAENKTFSFKLPFDDFIPLMDLAGTSESQSYGVYWANWPEAELIDNKVSLQKQHDLLNTRIWHWANENDATIGSTRLGIEVDWQTLLAKYHLKRGSYGFRIIVKGNTASTEMSDAVSIDKEYYFTDRDMYGNPYAFQYPYTQQKVLDVSDFLKINDISIYFYQDFNFADNENNMITYFSKNEDEEDENEKRPERPYVPHNIIYSNLKVYLGVSGEDKKTESTFLYSYNALRFDSQEIYVKDEEGNPIASKFVCDPEDDVKTILFTWVHYESNGTYSVIKNANDLLKQRNKAGKKTHVFWYRYNYEATEADNTWASNVTGKEYLSKLEQDWNNSQDNLSYESDMERYAGSYWTFLPYATDDFSLNFTPRGDKSREKFKVVIQHDGSHTTSEEIIFKNTRDVEAELLSDANNDAVVIKIFKTKKVRDENNRWVDDKTYEAVEDGSVTAFHVYDENNAVLVNDDDEYFNRQYYYAQIQVRDEISNEYQRLSTVSPKYEDENGEEKIVGYMETSTTVSWAFPREYTMLEPWTKVDVNDAKLFGLNPDSDSLHDQINYLNFFNSTIKFKIGSTFNNRNVNNVISAIIMQNGKAHHIERNLMFGRAEGLGHDYLPVIEIIKPEGNTHLLAGTNFQIGCVVYNKDGSLFKNPSFLNITWRELSGKAKFQHIEEINGEETIIEGFKTGPYVKAPNETYSKYHGYKNCCVSGKLCTEKKMMDVTLENGEVVKQEVEMAYPPIFEVTVTGAADYPLIVRKSFLICNNDQYKDTHTILAPTRVEFKSDGAKPIYYSGNFEVSQPINNKFVFPIWKINDEQIFRLQSKTTDRTFIQQQDGTTDTECPYPYTEYSLIFKEHEGIIGDTEKDKITPQWQEKYLNPEYYTYLYYVQPYTAGNTNINVYVAQSIAFDRNLYSSSLVNDWDGTSLTWDEDNGAILSTMIAAGTKDNGVFTGVMMGDWKSKGDESLDVPGLYGYNKGAQTFGFKTDGTGFIGASGKGRIVFDGREAIISNHDRSCYINLNPVIVHDSEQLFSGGNLGFSENFIYCKVNKTNNDFSSLSGAISGENSWSKEYFKDAAHDYFIVDPNYGVLTTGGVVARYGSIGNWMISNEGLYQKETGHYVYLGHNSTDMSSSGSGKWYTVKSNLTSIRTFINEIYSEWDALITEYNTINTEYETKQTAQAGQILELDNAIEKCNKDINDCNTEISDIDTRITNLTNDINTRETTILSQYNNITTQYELINREYDKLYVDDPVNNKKSLYTQLFEVLDAMDLENINYSQSDNLSTFMSHYNAFNKCKQDLNGCYATLLSYMATELTEEEETENIKTLSTTVNTIKTNFNKIYLAVEEENYTFSNYNNTMTTFEHIKNNINILQDAFKKFDKTLNEKIKDIYETSGSQYSDDLTKIRNDINDCNTNISTYLTVINTAYTIIQSSENDAPSLSDQRKALAQEKNAKEKQENELNRLYGELDKLNNAKQEIDDYITKFDAQLENIAIKITTEIIIPIKEKVGIVSKIIADINDNNEGSADIVSSLPTVIGKKSQENEELSIPEEDEKDNIITNIDKALDETKNIIAKKYIEYAIYIAKTEPQQDVTHVMPYFSVDWNGEMFARKGIIGNTWIINDYGLTYKKNNDILYLGSESYTNSDLIKDEPINYTPKGRKLLVGQEKIYTEKEIEDAAEKGTTLVNDTTCWAFSASDKYPGNDDELYPINFGVTTAGELYSQKGTIGGLIITQNTITSPASLNNHYLILDAQNNCIKTDDESFKIEGNTGTIRLRAGTGDSNNTEAGLLYLADYLIMGRTIPEDINVDSHTKDGVEETTKRTIGLGATDDYGWDSVKVRSVYIDTKSQKWIKNLNFKLTPETCNYLQFLDDNTDHRIDSTSGRPGAVLVTGPKYYKNDKTEEYDKIIEYDMATIFYPVQNGGILGLSGHRWNVMAQDIDAKLIYSSGGINGYEMYENFERLATQVWVTNALADVWNAIAAVSNEASSASRKSNAKSIVDVNWDGSSMAAQGGCYNLGLKFTTGNGSTFYSSGKCPVAGDSHNHTCSLTRNGTTLYLDIQKPSNNGTGKDDVSLSHSHTVTGTMSDDGTFSGTVSDANFSEATATFKIDCSEWLKAKVESIWSNNVYVTCTAATKAGSSTTCVATAKAELKWSTLTKKHESTDEWSCEASHGGYTKSNMANAWTKGWNACNNGDGRDENPYV